MVVFNHFPIPGKSYSRRFPPNSDENLASTISDQLGVSAAQKLSKSRSHQSTSAFRIFVDKDVPSILSPDAPNTLSLDAASSNTRRHNLRIPLGIKIDNGNSRGFCAPSSPSRPFQYSPADPMWEDTENHIPDSMRATSVSIASFSAQSPPIIPSSTGPPHWWSHPTSPANSRAPSPISTPSDTAHSSNIRHQNNNSRPHIPLFRARRAKPSSAAIVGFGRPRNMELYGLLGLKNWNAGILEIKAAYKKLAMRYHPDKVAFEDREAAHSHMAKINAAKDVLTNGALKRKYNKDGKVPWAP